jgi:hypothetical protein
LYVGIDSSMLFDYRKWLLKEFSSDHTIVISTVTLAEIYPNLRDKSYKVENKQLRITAFEELIDHFGKKHVRVAPPWENQIRVKTSGVVDSNLSKLFISRFRNDEVMTTMSDWDRRNKDSFDQLSTYLPSQFEKIRERHPQYTDQDWMNLFLQTCRHLYNAKNRDWASLNDSPPDYVLLFMDKLIKDKNGLNLRPLALAIFLCESIAAGQLLKHEQRFQEVIDKMALEKEGREWLYAFKSDDPMDFADAVISVDLFYCDEIVLRDLRFIRALEIAKRYGLLNARVRVPPKVVLST